MTEWWDWGLNSCYSLEAWLYLEFENTASICQSLKSEWFFFGVTYILLARVFIKWESRKNYQSENRQSRFLPRRFGDWAYSILEAPTNPTFFVCYVNNQKSLQGDRLVKYQCTRNPQLKIFLYIPVCFPWLSGLLWLSYFSTSLKSSTSQGFQKYFDLSG